MNRLVVLVAVVVHALAAGECAATERCLQLSFADRDGWAIGADDPWWSRVDIRDVLSLFHPLVESRAGATAGASRQCTIPADWQPPFLLLIALFAAATVAATLDLARPEREGGEGKNAGARAEVEDAGGNTRIALYSAFKET